MNLIIIIIIIIIHLYKFLMTARQGQTTTITTKMIAF
jgi:hypothetical protein